jgi:hypothetical protein
VPLNGVIPVEATNSALFAGKPVEESNGSDAKAEEENETSLSLICTWPLSARLSGIKPRIWRGKLDPHNQGDLKFTDPKSRYYYSLRLDKKSWHLVLLDKETAALKQRYPLED